MIPRTSLPDVLKKLNTRDEERHLLEKKGELLRSFSKDVVDSVCDTKLADRLISIACMYAKYRSLDTNGIISLRTNVSHTLEDHPTMSEKVYNALVEILQHHRAL
jgi:hypothetical protein